MQRTETKKINKKIYLFMAIMPAVTAYWDFKHLTSITH